MLRLGSLLCRVLVLSSALLVAGQSETHATAALRGAPGDAQQTLQTNVQGPTPAVAATAAHVQASIRSGQVKVQGVNLGSWLVVEKWMSENSPVVTAVDAAIGSMGEYSIMNSLGHARGDALFEQHRSQWITEADIAEIASFGLNTVRVPVGFWIMGFDNNDPPNKQQWKVYAPGALKYLDTLINVWAVKYNVAVMISFHAHKGSQNGADHSAGVPEWDPVQQKMVMRRYWPEYPENMENSVQVSLFLASRYKDSPAFLGINLMNEPDFDGKYADNLKNYYLRAYQLIRATGNDCVLVMSPFLYEQDGRFMRDFMRWPAYYNVWHEWHPYFIWGYEQSNDEQLMDAVRGKQMDIRNWPGNYLNMGEWTGAVNGGRLADQGKARQFLQAQLQAFREAQGFTYWSWKHSDDMVDRPNMWSMRQQLRNGNLQLRNPTLPATVTLKAVVNGKFVSADNAGSSPLIANRATAQGWEVFDIVTNADNTISFKARANGKFVTAENAGQGALIASRASASLWEKFTVFAHPDGTFSFRSQVNGRFVCADNIGASPLIANRNFAQDWEKFWVAAA